MGDEVRNRHRLWRMHKRMKKYRWAPVRHRLQHRLAGMSFALCVLGSAAACDATDPTRTGEYVLVKANGRALPAIDDSFPVHIYSDPLHYSTHVYVSRWTSGTLVLHSGL